MVPSIEGLETRPPFIRKKIFSLNLDTPEPLDLSEFDKQAQEIADGEAGAVLKWIVRGSRMFVFHGFEHKDIHEILNKQGNVDPLLSAGRLMVTDFSRRVGSDSDTLERVLNKRDSNQYKIGVLAAKLGDGFKVD